MNFQKHHALPRAMWFKFLYHILLINKFNTNLYNSNTSRLMMSTWKKRPCDLIRKHDQNLNIDRNQMFCFDTPWPTIRGSIKGFRRNTWLNGASRPRLLPILTRLTLPQNLNAKMQQNSSDSPSILALKLAWNGNKATFLPARTGVGVRERNLQLPTWQPSPYRMVLRSFFPFPDRSLRHALSAPKVNKLLWHFVLRECLTFQRLYGFYTCGQR